MANVLVTVNTFAVVPFLNKKGPIVNPLPISKENALKLKSMGFDVKIFGDTEEKKDPAVQEAPKQEESVVEEPAPEVMEEAPVQEQVVPEGYALFNNTEGEIAIPEGVVLYTDPEGKLCTLNLDGSVNEYFDFEEEESSETAEEGTEEKPSKKRRKRK